MEGNVLLSVDLPVQEWGDLGIALQFSVGTLERIDAESAVRVEDDFRFAKQLGKFDERIFAAPAGNIKARCLLRVFLGAGHRGSRRMSKRKVTIQELIKENCPRAYLTLSPAVVRNKETGVRVENEMEIAVEIDGVSAVPNNPVAVSRFFIKTQSHAIQTGIGSKLTRVHQFCGFRPKNLRAAEPAVLQVRDYELTHVRRARGNAPSRKRLHKLKWFGFLRGASVPARHKRLQVRGERLNESRVAHAQGTEDVVGHVLLERLSRRSLNDVARHAGRVIRVRGSYAWRKNSSRDVLAQILAERPHFRSACDEQLLGGILETRRVGHNIS